MGPVHDRLDGLGIRTGIVEHTLGRAIAPYRTVCCNRFEKAKRRGLVHKDSGRGGWLKLNRPSLQGVPVPNVAVEDPTGSKDD